MQEIQSVIVGAPPASAFISGTGDGTDGIIKKQVVETPAGQPNQVTAYIPTFVALLVRAGSIFTTTLLGQLAAGSVGVIPVQTWREAALIAGSATAVGMVTSIAALLSSLEKKYPIVTQIT